MAGHISHYAMEVEDLMDEEGPLGQARFTPFPKAKSSAGGCLSLSYFSGFLLVLIVSGVWYGARHDSLVAVRGPPRTPRTGQVDSSSGSDRLDHSSDRRSSSSAEQQQESTPVSTTKPPEARAVFTPSRPRPEKLEKMPLLTTPPETPVECKPFEQARKLAAEPFQTRIKRDLTDDTLAMFRTWCGVTWGERCGQFVLRDGKIYVRGFYPGFQSRHRATMSQLYRVMLKFAPILPDTDLALDFGDSYMDNSTHLTLSPPAGLPVGVVAFSLDPKTTEKPYGGGYLYPDFSFFAWPESACGPDKSHAMTAIRDMVNATVTKLPFGGRKDRVFWRGGQFKERKRIIDLLKAEEGFDLAKIKHLQTQEHVAPRAQGDLIENCVGLAQNCEYKYLAFLEGRLGAYSSRLKFLMMCGGVVFRNSPGWTEWWYPLLDAEEEKNGPLTVQVRDKTLWFDAPEQLKNVRAGNYVPPEGSAAARGVAAAKKRDGAAEAETPEKSQAEEIGRRTKIFADKWFSDEAADCYWLFLLQEMARVVPADPDVDVLRLKPMEDLLFFGNRDSVQLAEALREEVT